MGSWYFLVGFMTLPGNWMTYNNKILLINSGTWWMQIAPGAKTRPFRLLSRKMNRKHQMAVLRDKTVLDKATLSEVGTVQEAIDLVYTINLGHQIEVLVNPSEPLFENSAGPKQLARIRR